MPKLMLGIVRVSTLGVSKGETPYDAAERNWGYPGVYIRFNRFLYATPSTMPGWEFDLFTSLRRFQWTPTVENPTMLGDKVRDALELVGITSARVQQWLGVPCNCDERRQKLNQLDFWARMTLTKMLLGIRDGKSMQPSTKMKYGSYLEAIMGDKVDGGTLTDDDSPGVQ